MKKNLKQNIDMHNKQLEELDHLIKEVIKKRDRIIPVIGDNCFVGLLDNENSEGPVTVPLQEWIVETMLEDSIPTEKKKQIASGGYRGQDMLYDELCLIKRVRLVNFLDSLVSTIENGLDEKRIFLRNDVKDFLRAGSFDVVVTTCPFHILEQELSQEGQKYNNFSFSPTSIPRGNIQEASKSEVVLKFPAIYQVFGDCDGEFVFGEEDLLKFLHYLNFAGSEKGYGASPLVKYIQNKNSENKGNCLMMPIGCDNLPNWLFRFLWYPFSSECLSTNTRNSKGGVWHKFSDDEDFYNFLQKYDFLTFSNSTSSLKDNDTEGDPVLERLTAKLQSEKGDIEKLTSSEFGVLWNADETWDVFLSYASEDVEMATMIYNVLTTRCKKRVWMDKRLIRGGDKYLNVIQHGIEHSKRFLFVITEAYLSKGIGKNYENKKYGFSGPSGVYQELDRIRQFFIYQRRDGKAKEYCVPLIMSGTKVSYTDFKGDFHTGVDLNGSLLERLHLFEEYQLLQTDVIFEGVEALVSNPAHIEEDLISLFNA